ncbi:MAG: phosphotransferase [Muribaculaceae bacterium]|nr:phosphotransferase [Muribaculaceae bacterium]
MNESNILQAEHSLKNLFESFYNISEVRLTPIVGSGSDRLYFRMSADNLSCIGTYVPDAAEGRCFVELAKGFLMQGKAVPEIYAVSPDYHCYLQEDLGDKSLFSLLNAPCFEALVKETLIRLASLQKTPENIWRPVCVNKDFSQRQILWDLNYFKYEYVKPRNVVFDEDRLEDDFESLAKKLEGISDEFCGFMMRDCQSRNVMVTDDGPVFIDFQGGRKGPALYDAVSFLWQARAGLSDDFRKSMLEFYCMSYCDGDLEKKDEMLSALNEMVLFRTLQVLGAYGFRGLVQQKSHFLLSIPGALANLRALLCQGVLEGFPELKKVSEALVSDPMFEVSESTGGLTVEIFSFSYKKGYPQDLSGNGGGFVFDCRALHNPGRYKEYRQLTGRDRAVIEYLEKRGEVQPFLKSVWSLTDAAIERYLHRGFSHIQISFGCTGGQHRSVYSAEHTAAHVRATFPEANVRVVHREHPSADK